MAPQVPEKNDLGNEFTTTLVLQPHDVLLLSCGPALTGWHPERECAVPSSLRHGEAVHEGRVAIGSLLLPCCHQTPRGGGDRKVEVAGVHPYLSLGLVACTDACTRYQTGPSR